MRRVNSGNKIVSGTLWRFSERIAAQLVSFIVSVILARILLPEDYGIVAIVNIFITIAEIFVTNGLGLSLIQKKEADEIDFSTVFWCNILLSLVLYAVVFLLAPVVAKFYNIALLVWVLRVLGLRLPIAAITSVQSAYVSRKMDFKKFFFATIIGTIISGIVGIAMAYKGFGVWALVAQTLTNSTIDTLVLFIAIKWKPKFVFSAKRAKPLVSYGWKILANDFIETIFNQLNSFLIGKKCSSADLAYYTQGKKMPDLITSNITGALSSVLFPAMSLSSGKDEIVKIRRKTLKLMEYVMFPLLFGLVAIGDKVVVVLMTEKWLFAVPYLRITCIAAIPGVIGATLVQEVRSIGRSDVMLKLELLKKPVVLLIVVIAMKYGAKAIAWTLVIKEIIEFLFNVCPVKKHIGFDMKMHLLDAVPPFIMSVVMAILVYFIGFVIDNNLLCLIVQIVAGMVIYVGLSLFSKNESFEYLKNLILDKIR